MNKSENNTPKQEHNNNLEHTIAAHVANHQDLESGQELIGPPLPEKFVLVNNEKVDNAQKEDAPTKSNK